MPAWARPARRRGAGWGARAPYSRRRMPGLALTLVLLLAAAALFLIARLDEPSTNFAGKLSGRARAVDGDTLRLGGADIRLIGIDAPEYDQTCRDTSGADWPCGRVAREQLASAVDGAETACAADGHDIYGRTLARCVVAGSDLGAAMVRGGLAIASGGYAAEEREARAAARGLWAGTFETPRQWRERAQGFDLLGWFRSWLGQ